MDDQKYLNEYLNSVNGDSSLTQDSKDLIAKHIHGLRAFVQQRQANENKDVKNPVSTPVDTSVRGQPSVNPPQSQYNPNQTNQPTYPNQNQPTYPNQTNPVNRQP